MNTKTTLIKSGEAAKKRSAKYSRNVSIQKSGRALSANHNETAMSPPKPRRRLNYNHHQTLLYQQTFNSNQAIPSETEHHHAMSFNKSRTLLRQPRKRLVYNHNQTMKPAERSDSNIDFQRAQARMRQAKGTRGMGYNHNQSILRAKAQARHHSY